MSGVFLEEDTLMAADVFARTRWPARLVCAPVADYVTGLNES